MTEFILRIIAAGGYAGIAFLMALENVVPPIPSEIIMGFGGIAAARGQLDFTLLVIVGTLGATAGNLAWYAVGRRLGTQRIKPFIDRHGRWLTLDWADIESLQRQFRTRGGRIVFIFRLLPNFRTLISLPAGMAGMPLGRFTAFTLAGTTIWNIVLAGAGYLLGSRFSEIDRYVGPLGLALIVGCIALYLYRVATWRPAHAR